MIDVAYIYIYIYIYVLRLRPCRRPLLETGGCMKFDVFLVTLGAGGIVLASIWVLWMAMRYMYTFEILRVPLGALGGLGCPWRVPRGSKVDF